MDCAAISAFDKESKMKKLKLLRMFAKNLNLKDTNKVLKSSVEERLLQIV